MADEINENRDFIDPEELWYEEDADNRFTSSQISHAQRARTEILQITLADLEPVNAHPNTSNTKDTIHMGFVTAHDLVASPENDSIDTKFGQVTALPKVTCQEIPPCL